MLNLTVETALSDYYDNAEAGDVIKSHDAFAYFTVSNNVGRWRGNLQYLKPGEGYMFLRKGTGEVGFRYPFYEPGSTFLDEWDWTDRSAASLARAMTTMTVSAVIDGFDAEDGDVLVAYVNGQRAGRAPVPFYQESQLPDELHDPIYLSIAGDSEAGIWFAIERDGETVAFTSEQMMYKSNAVIGSPDEPTKISFVQANPSDRKWYTLSGVRLPNKPTAKGIYIFNGKKVVIK